MPHTAGPSAGNTLRFGLKIAPEATPLADMRAVWKIADTGGFDHVWAFDHYAAVDGDPARPVLEGWTLLAAMAEATKRVRIGLLVTGNHYRHPGVLAKIATTVDHLSNGRLEFGIGAGPGWAEYENAMLGIPVDTTAGRIRRLDEALEFCKLLWTQDRPSFAGTYYQLKDAIHEPKPVQHPHPPIWIGGSGEKLTLGVVAKHADVWNPSSRGNDPDECARLSAVLDERCVEVGRDPAAIRRSIQIRWDGSDTAALAGRFEQFIERGFTELIVYVFGPDAVASAERVAADVLPQFRARSAAVW